MVRTIGTIIQVVSISLPRHPNMSLPPEIPQRLAMGANSSSTEKAKWLRCVLKSLMTTFNATLICSMRHSDQAKIAISMTDKREL